MTAAKNQLGRRLHAHRQAAGLSALAVSRRAGLSMNYVRNVERGVSRPRSEGLYAICQALNLADEEVAELLRLAGLNLAPVEEPHPGLTLWQHLPRALLDRVQHDEIVLFDRAADDLVADITRGIGPMLSWLALLEAPPSRVQANRLRSAARAAFERSLHLREETHARPPATPIGAASDAASVLPRAWRHEVFARRETTARLAEKLARWHYRLTSNRIDAWLKDEASNLIYSFWEATASSAADVHDAMIAHRLWTDLDLASLLGTAAGSAYEWDFAGQLVMDLGVLLGSDIATRIAASLRSSRSSGESSEEYWKCVHYVRAAAQRADLALRLFELPELAARVIKVPRPGAPYAPITADALSAALSRATEFVGGLSIRFPGSPPATPPQPPSGGDRG